MNPKLNAAINQQEDWTFEEVLGLAAQFNLKTRYVIACVHQQGKRYIDGKRPLSEDKPE